MLFFNEKGDFAFVKVAQNSLLSGISASALGAMSCLALAKTNPKHDFSMKYIRSVLHPYVHADAALSELERFGYLTKHCYPAGESNVFFWKIECDSFHQNAGSFGIVYHGVDGKEQTGSNLRHVRPVPVSDRFIRVPKNLILNKNLSLRAKGLFVHLMFFCHTAPDLSSKEDIRKKAGMSSYEFRNAWKELKENGYLTAGKTKERKYSFVLHAEPLPAENEHDAKGADKKRAYYKINTLNSEKRARSEKSITPEKKEKPLKGYQMFTKHSYNFDELEFSLWLNEREEDILTWKKQFGSAWQTQARSVYERMKKRRKEESHYDFAALNAFILAV